MGIKTLKEEAKSLRGLCAFFPMIIILFFIGLMSTSCESRDPETEQKLEGTWKADIVEMEDGVMIMVTMIEKYSLSNHEYSAEISYFMHTNYATVTYSGKWEASKSSIMIDIDKESIKFYFNTNITDRSERKEFKEEMLAELKKNGYCEIVPINSSITDRFETEDEDGEKLTYYRIN